MGIRMIDVTSEQAIGCSVTILKREVKASGQTGVVFDTFLKYEFHGKQCVLKQLRRKFLKHLDRDDVLLKVSGLFNAKGQIRQITLDGRTLTVYAATDQDYGISKILK